MRFSRSKDRKGAALVTTIGVLAILLAVVVTLMTLTRLEFRTASNAVHSARAKFIAEGGVSIASAVLQACDPTFASLNQAWRTYFNGNADGVDNDNDPDGNIDYWNPTNPNQPIGDTYFKLVEADPGAVAAQRDADQWDNRPAMWSELKHNATIDSGIDNDGDGVLDSAWFLVTVPLLDDNNNPRTIDDLGRPTINNGVDDDYDLIIDEPDEIMEQVIGRFAVLVTDEASKLNINAAGNLAGGMRPAS
ncbi:MAG: hypothetical protein J7M12_00010 [Candidatus Hydrogenedentes bacterium]|nr:hypothetical protein [Candidatus Hydrogenedentota bacterium]